MNTKFILGVILFSMQSCNMGKKEFAMISSRGLDKENLGLKMLLFHNSDTGFVIGSSDSVWNNPDMKSDTFAFSQRTALIYKTIDGGKTWSGSEFGFGYFSNIVETGGVLFALKISEDQRSTTVYSSSNLGTSWQEKASFPKNIFDIIKIDSLIYAFGSDSNAKRNQIYLSRDMGNSWRRSGTLEYPIFGHGVLDKENILFLCNSKLNSYSPNLLVEYNPQSNNSKSIGLPNTLETYFLANYNGITKLIGKDGNYIKIYSVESEILKFESSYQLEDGMPFLAGFYFDKKTNWVIVGRRQGLEVVYELLKTGDKESSWKRISFLRDDYISPFYFIDNYGKTNGWFFAGSGNFQVIH